METSKADWKLFQKKIPAWQERYMERLNNEYVEMLSGEGKASEKFWELEKRIKEDRRNPGVMIRLDKKEVAVDLARLINYEVITADDLEGFSEEMKETVLRMTGGN